VIWNPAFSVHLVRRKTAPARREVSTTMRADQHHDLIIKITPNDRGNSTRKLADVELHFGADRRWPD
jgi:hypothetical protein